MASEKQFRQIIRDRILEDMLIGGRQPGTEVGPNEWKVLIADAYTLKVISSSCKMSAVTDKGISLVEDIGKRRQPQPTMDALYFIQPSKMSFSLFLNDMQGKAPLYKRAHVYFSRPLPKSSLDSVTNDPLLRSRLSCFREMNLEILTVDMQGFVTDHGDALMKLFGQRVSSAEYEQTIDEIAGRLATVFASLKEFPTVRYKAAKASSAAAGSAQRMREMVPTKLAAALWERLVDYQKKIKDFPQQDTCDLLIVDRSVDVIAPIIHDWSYGGMCFDLLPVDGSKYEYETTGANGNPEKKTVLLDEHDPIWLEVRDLFLAEAYEKVNAIFAQVSSKTSTREGELSGRELHDLVQNLSLYRDQKDKVELHLKISSSVSKMTQTHGLFDVGQLEQGFVFGDKAATYKELSSLLKDKEDLDPFVKLRLLMVYAATHPDKLDSQKLTFWSKLAGLGDEEMQALKALEFLGVPLGKQEASKGFSLTFGARKSGTAMRTERRSTEEAFELSRFYPALEDILKDLHAGTLPTQEYPFVQEPTRTGAASSASSTPSSSSRPSSQPASGTASPSGPVPASKPSSSRAGLSVRKKPQRDDSGSSTSSNSSSQSGSGGFASGSSLASWALKGLTGQDDAAAASKAGPSGGGGSHGGKKGGPQERGRRLIVFVVGGMTRSEIGVAHLLSKQLNREVLFGSTCLDTPTQFLQKLKRL